MNGDGLTFPLIGGETAVLSLPRPISEENFDLVLSLLQTLKPALIGNPMSVEPKYHSPKATAKLVAKMTGRPTDDLPTELKCRDCGKTKPLDQMTKNKKIRCGRSNICKVCQNIKWAKFRQAKKAAASTPTPAPVKPATDSDDTLPPVHKADKLPPRRECVDCKVILRIGNTGERCSLCEMKRRQREGLV